jgi:hypothetical protein
MSFTKTVSIVASLASIFGVGVAGYKLAETCGITPNKYKVCISWEEELLKFARAIYSEGFSDGCKEGSYSDYTWMRP